MKLNKLLWIISEINEEYIDIHNFVCWIHVIHLRFEYTLFL